MPSYVNIFGGQTINPTLVSYVGYTISADLTLVWPFEALDGDAIAPAKIDVVASNGGLGVTLPDTTLVSVGQDILFNNTGSNSFTVFDSGGNALATLQSGEAWYFYLVDNSTTYGTWRVFKFGAGTSAANAASLAGFGLAAIITTLNQNLPTTSFNSNETLTANNRAGVLQNTGGSVVWTLPDAAVGNGWFFYAINSGSGTLTLTPAGGQTLDGNSTKVLNPNENCIIFSDGANFWSLGYGRSIVSTVTGIAINAAGSGDLVLNASQIAAQVQDFSGTLTGNRTITYGTGVGYWFVYNGNNGPYTTTFRVNNIDTGVVVPEGNYAILRSDGSTMSVAFTATAGTVTSVGTTAGQLVGGPITSSGTIGLATTAVTPGMYGDAATVPQITVDAYGRLTGTTAIAIQISFSQVNTFTSAALLAHVTDPTGTGNAVFSNAPALTNPTATTQAATDNSTLVATTAFTQAAITAALSGAVFVTGDIKFTQATTVADGWVTLDGGTIGNAASGATTRANADTASLFAFYWNNYNNTICPVSTGRGASAAADFAANKTITILDGRGRFFAAADMGAGRLGGGPTGGITGTATPGATGGEQGTVLDVTQIPAHTHTSGVATGPNAQSVGGPVTGAGSGNTGSTGGGLQHNNTPPALVVNVWVKL